MIIMMVMIVMMRIKEFILIMMELQIIMELKRK